MAARRSIPPRSIDSLQTPSVEDKPTSQAIDAVASAVQKLQAKPGSVVVDFDLAIGTNKIPHGLGRACRGYTITPSTTTAFTHCLDNTNPRADQEIWITIATAAQLKAVVQIF